MVWSAAGGYAASHLAANALSNATDEELQMLQGDIGSDTSMAASALLAGRKNPTVAPAAVPAKPVAPVQPAPAAPAAPAAPPASPMSISDPSQVGPQYSLGKPPSAAPTDNAGLASAPAVNSPTSDPFIASLMNKISGQEAESKKNAETNKYLALMQAGFGMMGGTSPYAAVNIGQGAEKGVGTYATLNAATQKEQNDLMNQQLGLYKYSSSADVAKSRLEQDKLYHDTLLNQNVQKQALALASGREDKYRKQFFIEGVAPNKQQLDSYNNALKNDATYQKLLQEAGYAEAQQPFQDSKNRPPLSTFNK